MKKTIIAAFIGIAALAVNSANAQTAISAQTQIQVANATECCNPDAACAQTKAFEGLNLTTTQQNQIKKIQDECRKQCDAERAQQKSAKQAAKAEKARTAMDKRRAYLAQVKNVLTPEQYVTYLENEFVNSGAGRPSGSRPDKFRKENKKAKGNNNARFTKDAKREDKRK